MQVKNKVEGLDTETTWKSFFLVKDGVSVIENGIGDKDTAHGKRTKVYLPRLRRREYCLPAYWPRAVSRAPCANFFKGGQIG